MALYGAFKYGTAVYGTNNPEDYAADLLLHEHNYGAVRVGISRVPPGGYQAMKIVRSSVGEPAFISDGTTVYSQFVDSFEDPLQTNTPQNQIAHDLNIGILPLVDSALPSGRWVYYSMFVYISANAAWLRVSKARLLVPYFYDGQTNLYNSMPSIFRTDLASQMDDPAYVKNLLLEKFYGVFGFQYDVVRSYTAALTEVHDPRRMAYPLVASALADFGTPFEESLGPNQMRRLLDNQMYFYKTKGTLKCVRGVAVAVTGFNAEVTIGLNLMYSQDFTSAAGSTALWQSSELTWRVDRDAAYVVYLGTPPVTTFKPVAASNTTAETAIFNCGPVTVPSVPKMSVQTRESAISITPLSSYAVGATFYNVMGSVTASWLDINGVLVGQAIGSLFAPPTSIGARVTDIFAAPANAAYILPGVRLSGLPTNGTVSPARWSQVLVASYVGGNVPVVYEGPRKIHIRLVPPRINLVSNPSFDTDLSNWTLFGSNLQFTQDIVNRDTAFRQSAVASAALQALNNITSVSVPSGIYIPFPTRVGARYAVRARNQLTNVGPNGASFRIGVWTSPDTTLVPLGYADITGLTQPTFNDPTPFVFTAVSPTSFLAVQINGLDAGRQINIDSVLVEQTDRSIATLGDYFDGDGITVLGEYLWSGVSKNSISMYYPQRVLKDARLAEILPKYLPFGTDFDVTYGLPNLTGIADDVKVIGNVSSAPHFTAVGHGLSVPWNNYVRNSSGLTTRWNLIGRGTSQSNVTWAVKKTGGVTRVVMFKDNAKVGPSLTSVWKVASR